VNFDFSDDQKLLADQVGKYLDDSCSSATVRKVLDGDSPMAHDVWQGLADMGLLGTAIPENYGGTGAGYLELCLVAQALGAHLAPVPFAQTVYLVTECLLQFGDDAQKQKWLPQIASGSVKASLVGPQTTSLAVEGGKLSGHAEFVSDGSVADLFVVLAGAEQALYIVEAGEGVGVQTVETIDLSRDAAAVTFDNARCEHLAGDGVAKLEQINDRAAVLMAFEQLGGAQSALQMAVNYSQERFAFGRPIATFQALKHMMADMYVAMKLAENNCYYAAWALQNDAPELPLAAATARVGATQAFQLCARDNIQVHGGMGFTWEFDCHLYYRRSNYLALELGGLTEWEGKLVAALPLAASA
jgi:alkylation response protein AidB-like acyl-CoA dehydrogenase